MKIHKYPIPSSDEFILIIPEQSTIMHVGLHQLEMFLWAMVDTEAPPEERTFRLVGTGHTVPDDKNLDYIGTITNHEGVYVWHIFEVVP